MTINRYEGQISFDRDRLFPASGTVAPNRIAMDFAGEDEHWGSVKGTLITEREHSSAGWHARASCSMSSGGRKVVRSNEPSLHAIAVDLSDPKFIVVTGIWMEMGQQWSFEAELYPATR